MTGLFPRWRIALLVLPACLILSLPVQACPFCTPGRPLTGEVEQASMVLFGTLTKADMTPRAGAPDGTTDMVIEKVIKNHEWLKDRKVVTLPRYVDRGPDSNKYRYLVFINFFKDRIDPYRGIEVKVDCDIAGYLKGAMELKNQSSAKRLRFFFDYLDNDDAEISTDAYAEFANADYKEVAEVAKTLPSERIAGWLKDGRSNVRFGLYASMLGHCGTEKHATQLREMLDKAEQVYGSGVDGMLAGYVMLKPKEGWDYLQSILKDPTKKFLHRYAALRAVRFFWEYREDVIGKKDLTEALLPLLEMKDIADMAIEDFRKWKRFDLTDRILSLQNYPVYRVSVIKRSILRFALSAKSEAAARYVAAQRKADPEAVEDVEEMLKLDILPPTTATPKKDPKGARQ